MPVPLWVRRFICVHAARTQAAGKQIQPRRSDGRGRGGADRGLNAAIGSGPLALKS